MELTNLDFKKFPTDTYLLTLLNLCQHNHILSNEQISQIKLEILGILERTIQKFTGGDSSVSKERGQSLTDNILYVCALYLKQYSNKEVIELLRNEPFHIIYKQAQQSIHSLLLDIKEEIADLQCHLLEISLQVYTDTLYHGLSSFSTVYNPDYVVQDCVLTLDYPTYIPITNITGIELLYTYIQYMKIEHFFLNSLPITDITNVLEHYHSGNSQLIFNIPDLLLLQLLLNYIIDKPKLLPLTMKDINGLYRILQDKKKDEIIEELSSILNQICMDLNIHNASIMNYFIQGLPSLASRIYYSVLHHTLEKEVAL